MFTYLLPDHDGQAVEHISERNAVIFIGANGSGKSKLGAWIEQQAFESVHRIGAQRDLNFNENIALKNYEQAEDLVFYGATEPSHKKNKLFRWNAGKEYTTKMLTDFEPVLAALIALKNNEHDAFVESCKKAETEGKERPALPKTSIDKLQDVWNAVFPQRRLLVKDSKFVAVVNKNGKDEEYSANQMSDGERAVLYLAAQVLCVPKDKTMIIDEPEIHLHRSIMHRLWMALEQARLDCFFIYITHDTDFASMHTACDKIWIRAFDGEKWEYEKVNSTNLPEDMLLDILGSRKNILFVEGEKNSYDSQLYTLLYPDYHVIACGSCTQVIARTKTFRQNPTLHHCTVFGIIDRDFRSDYEIDAYKEDGIYTIDVAEVENLFLTEELIRCLANHLGLNENEVFGRIKQYVIDERYSQQLHGQICQGVVAEIKYRLSSAAIAKNSDIAAKESLDSLWNAISFDQIKSLQEEKFQRPLTDRDYAKVIKVFNQKNIVGSVGRYLGLQNASYCVTILNLLRGTKRQEFAETLKNYMPPEIPVVI